jgi:hypothetical protein
MRRPWRLTTVWQKALYIAAGWAVMALFLLALRTWLFDQHSWPYQTIGLVATLSYTLVGVRIFRGYLEPVIAPRAWWRWTGRPKAGFWLGALSLFATLSVFPNFWLSHDVVPNVPLLVLNVSESAFTALGYLNSSFRLRRHPELWSQRRNRMIAQTRPRADG